MASIVFDSKDIYPLIDHHIAILQRFGLADETPFSLIYFNLEDKPNIDYAKVFHQMLRKTDALFQSKKHFIVLLPGTDWNGATELLSGIQNFLSLPAYDNVVTYPEDGDDAKSLTKALYNKIEDNCCIEVKMLKSPY
jgi:hypothetical protein